MTHNGHLSDRNLRGSGPQPHAATGSTRLFKTILAIHHGEVYVPSSTLSGSGWLVRATAPANFSRPVA